MGMTYVQKLLAKACGRPQVAVGEVSSRRWTWRCRTRTARSSSTSSRRSSRAPAGRRGSGTRTASPSSSTTACRPSPRRRRPTRRRSASSSSKQGITKFHDIRGDVGGICHQVLPENGYVRPGQVVVGTDSHTTTHGALGAFAFGIGATEMAAVWTLGNILNVEVPGTIKVSVNGRLPRVHPAKDLILHLIGKLTAEGANYKVIEFHGGADPRDADLGPAGAVQHDGRGGGDGGGRAARRRDASATCEVEAGVSGPARRLRPRRRRRLRPGRRHRRGPARAADRLPAHGGQRQAGERGGRQEGPPDRGRLVHQRPARRHRDRRRDPARASTCARARGCSSSRRRGASTPTRCGSAT